MSRDSSAVGVMERKSHAATQTCETGRAGSVTFAGTSCLLLQRRRVGRAHCQIAGGTGRDASGMAAGLDWTRGK